MISLALTVIALTLFSREKIPLEYSCLAILAALVVIFEVFAPIPRLSLSAFVARIY